MKTSKTRIMILGLLAIAALVPLTPRVYAQNSASWQNPTFKGFDPYYSNSIVAYRTGATALLSLSLLNSLCSSVKVVAAVLQMDWGNNYTATGLPTTMTMGTRGTIAISFAVPGTSTASNLVLHDSIPAGSYLNITSPCSSGTQKSLFQNSGIFVPSIAVYSSDQADAISLSQQIAFLFSSSGTTNVCSGFKTAQGLTSCAQATQQAALGFNAYQMGNFTAAKANFQSAVNNWSNAISNENSGGGGLLISSTVSGYGSLLLGIGAIVGGIAAILYAIRRPKMLSATTTH